MIPPVISRSWVWGTGGEEVKEVADPEISSLIVSNPGVRLSWAQDYSSLWSRYPRISFPVHFCLRLLSVDVRFLLWKFFWFTWLWNTNLKVGGPDTLLFKDEKVSELNSIKQYRRDRLIYTVFSISNIKYTVIFDLIPSLYLGTFPLVSRHSCRLARVLRGPTPCTTFSLFVLVLHRFFSP